MLEPDIKVIEDILFHQPGFKAGGISIMFFMVREH